MPKIFSGDALIVASVLYAKSTTVSSLVVSLNRFPKHAISNAFRCQATGELVVYQCGFKLIHYQVTMRLDMTVPLA